MFLPHKSYKQRNKIILAPLTKPFQRYFLLYMIASFVQDCNTFDISPQEGIPLKVRNIYLVNASPLVDIMMKTAKPFLNMDLLKRVLVYFNYVDQVIRHLYNLLILRLSEMTDCTRTLYIVLSSAEVSCRVVCTFSVLN